MCSFAFLQEKEVMQNAANRFYDTNPCVDQPSASTPKLWVYSQNGTTVPDACVYPQS